MQEINLIRQREDFARVDEFRQRKNFRLWKIGRKLPVDADWYNVSMLFAPSLIFELSKPRPTGIYLNWPLEMETGRSEP